VGKVLAKTLLFTLLVPGTVIVLVPHELRAATGAVAAGALARAAGGVLGLVGLAVYCWCVLDFARSAGTPAPIDPPKELVARGLYRLARNPMYVGVLSMVSAQALWFGSGWLALYALLLFAAFHSFVVLYEEPTLARSFGAAYERYRATVPRWIFPARGERGGGPAG
jgi:protein-S-isoprenylcysteine O-methyltransferase Ste14